MKSFAYEHRRLFSLLIGLAVGLLAGLAAVGLAAAAPDPQEPEPENKECASCHLDVVNQWENSSHAHAFDDPVFQERWHGLNDQGDCLLCHTTGYQATSGEYTAPGVTCEACHGEVDPNHPEVPAPVRDDAAYCGACHTTTLSEWRLTGHSAANVGCTDCHNPHSQSARFEDPDQMCLNCHKDSMGEYLEDLHGQKGIGCVDCHALVIPPEVPPVDGIVPTGHSFTITPATCVACHTDTLHAGFSLPGWEAGAAAALEAGEAGDSPEPQPTPAARVHTPEERIQALETQTQTLQAALASRNLTTLFQGGIVGLVLGGSTAWIVANNLRRARKEEDAGDEEE
ncbi:MAG: hypothetical protein GX495_20445 [Chloroflexi bacterium]|nr:hypothetical protein [Chloroflexota bacterium]